MPQSMEIFVKTTKARIVLSVFGLAPLCLSASYLTAPPAGMGPTMHQITLLFIPFWVWGGAVLLTTGLFGGFPQWSHAFTPLFMRNEVLRRYNDYVASRLSAVSPYKGGSRTQVRWLQWGLVVLITVLAVLLAGVVGAYRFIAGLVGACIGGLVAMFTAEFLRR